MSVQEIKEPNIERPESTELKYSAEELREVCSRLEEGSWNALENLAKI
jgi:hypothetical protein